jgi:N-methylhydantoinase A
MSLFVAVDTGGTFTDLVVFDAARDRLSYTKSLTTHHNPIEAILTCVAKTKIDLRDATLFKHGTTHVINTLIERSGPKIAFVTTRGFRDVLDFGRGNRTEPFNLSFRRDPPLVPRQLRFEIDERIDGQGTILTAPRREDVVRLADQIRSLEVSGIAVSFLNSYIEPANERLVAEWLRKLMPDCYIATGVDLSREWYEYERASTATANAYTGPKVGGYVRDMDKALTGREFRGQLLMMGSNGGILSAQHSTQSPILLVESGPVGGCMGAGVYGKALGFQNVIAFDMGGTTAKCALVRDGKFDVESTYYAGGYGRGIPIRTPVVDIVEVGAGGGSIASIDGQNRLNVGPRSAGSFPGPVAYARGGTEPTVTDANLILGRLDASRFQGGEMTLDLPGAYRAIEERLAQPLGYRGEMGVHELASGILSIAAVKMSEAIKRITVERGKDPRDFVLFAYGGGGPLHSAELARELGIPLVVIPPEAGNFSAIGMLLADIRRDQSRTFLRNLDAGVIGEINAICAEIETEMIDAIRNDFGGVSVTFERFVEMRYVGQYHTVRVQLEAEDADALKDKFNRIYRERYGHAMESAAAETVSLHCVAMAQLPRPNITQLTEALPAGKPNDVKHRPIYFPEAGARLSTAVFSRANLPLGFRSDGPVVIEEYGSTTLVGPNDRFEIGRLGEIQITINQGAWEAAV